MPDDHTLASAIRAATAVTGGTYELPVYPFVEPAELRGERLRHPVVIVGAGLTGLTAACDCALRGIPAVVLDEDDTVGVRGAASRGICYAQKSLEIYKRLGILDRMLAKGIQWSVGRTSAGNDEVYSFDLKKMQTHSVSEQPPFINLQQFYVEWFLVERIHELGLVELRWKNRVIEIAPNQDHVVLTVATPSGPYTLQASWVIDCCGAHSVIRDKLGVHATGSKIADRWCISDVRFEREPPAERWTWIEAPFNENRAVWQHLMADRVWRLDYQMPADADPEAISRPEVVADRLRRQFGPDVKYELVWVGPYAYRSLCLDTFRVGRVLFAGDAAHVMSPFGARGGNSGIQDADNLVWKLALVLEGKAPERLLDSYAIERRQAALDNIRITNRTTRFLSPPTRVEKRFRDAVISLAREFPFARAFVNTGRLSSPTRYVDSPIAAGGHAGVHVQNVVLTLPNGARGDLVELLQWCDHAVLGFLYVDLDGYLAREIEGLEQRYPVRFLCVQSEEGRTCKFPTVIDDEGKLAAQLHVAPGAVALVRPDLYLAGTLEEPSAADIERALRKLLAIE
jgi:3-(3-hydroxy-phenyl)propionate hydroxylase